MKHNLLTALLLTLLSLPSFAQLNCDYIDPVCQKARELMNQGQYDQALRGLEKAKSDPGIRNCSDAYKIDNLISQIQKKRASNLCPDTNHPHLIDLGLPSGTKWACCNVGASLPEDYGNYYAWGETTTKSTYDWSNYKWCRGAKDKLTKYCTKSSYGTVDNKTVLEPSDDAASAIWGESWRMPTLTQFYELIEKCTLAWITVKGTSGMKFTSSNGASIFLPAAGYHWGDNSGERGSLGCYRSSILHDVYPDQVSCVNFNSGKANGSICFREIGLPVRPVRCDNLQSYTDNPNTAQAQTFTVKGVSFKMIDVEGGSFDMGSDSGSSDEVPIHRVTLSEYSIGETEVTQALWQTVMGNNPSYFKGDNMPVENISWKDCQKFIRKLNEMTQTQRSDGREFRLPTEAEWEFAARGGNKSRHTEYAGSSAIGDVAWYKENGNNRTHPVAQKAPNELGLYDMTGNVQEWCHDWYDSEYYRKSPSLNPCNEVKASSRVLRGGSRFDNARYSRVFSRSHFPPGDRGYTFGFRLAR